MHIETSDWWYVIGQLSWKTMAGKKWWHLIWWIIETVEWWLSTQILAEMDEEINLSQNHIQDIHLLWAWWRRRSEIWNAWLICKATLNIPKEKVYELFKEKNDGEFKDLLFVSLEERDAFLKEIQSDMNFWKELIV